MQRSCTMQPYCARRKCNVREHIVLRTSTGSSPSALMRNLLLVGLHSVCRSEPASERVHGRILHMADMLSEGIITQFSKKFD